MEPQKEHLVQPSLYQAHLRAQGVTLLSLQNLQMQRLLTPFGTPNLGFHYFHWENYFLASSLNLMCFHSCPVCLVPQPYPLWKGLLPSCWPPFRCYGACVGSSQQLSLPQSEWSLILLSFQGECSSLGHVKGSLLTLLYHHLFFSGDPKLNMIL